jgi:hypothetical protein
MNILSGTFHTVKNAVNPPKYHYFASLKLKIFTQDSGTVFHPDSGNQKVINIAHEV